MPRIDRKSTYKCDTCNSTIEIAGAYGPTYTTVCETCKTYMKKVFIPTAETNA